MADDRNILDPLIGTGAARTDIAPTPQVSQASDWAAKGPTMPRAPLLLVFFAPIAAVGAGIAIPDAVLERVVSYIGPANTLRFFGVIVPLGMLLAFAWDRIIRHTRASNRVLWAAYHIAWCSVSSWKPDVEAKGNGLLLSLGGRVKDARELLFHLLIFLAAFGLLCAGMSGGIAFAYLRGWIPVENAAWALAANVLSLGATIMGFIAVRRRRRNLGASDADIQRAGELNQQCHQEKQKWRRGLFG